MSTPDERAPLLASRPSWPPLPSPKAYAARRTSPTRVLVFLAFWIALLGAADELVQPPMTRVFESIYCRIFYENGSETIGRFDDIPEERCKNSWIQGQVAALKGWQLFLDCIPALVLAIPFGWFADKYGRKKLLIMLSVAFFLRLSWQLTVCWFWPSLPIRIVWLSALHAIMGGSSTVASAMLFVVVSDVTTETERATGFMRTASAQYLASFLSPPLSAMLMRRNPWIPLLLGWFLQFLCIPIAFWLPETLNYLHADEEGVPIDGETTPIEEEEDSTSHLKAPWYTTTYNTIRSSTTTLTSDIRVAALLTTFCIHTFVLAAGPLLLQYLSARYNLTLSTSTLILSLRSVFVAIVFILLPYLSNSITSLNDFSALNKDMFLARVSAILLALAFLGVALSPTAALCLASLLLSTTGSGLFMFVRSVLAALVSDRDVAKVFAITGLIDTAGMMVGGPSMAALFGRGLEMGKNFAGLPFMVSAGCLGMVTVVLFIVSVNEKRVVDDGEEEEREGLFSSAEQESEP